MPVVRFVHWKEDGAWLGCLQDYPDYWSPGETLDDLKEHLKELYDHVRGSSVPNAVRAIQELPMSPTTENVFQAALALPEEDRFELIEALVAASNPPGVPPFDESWRDVISRRSAEIDAGTAQLVPWEEARRRIQQRLDARG